MWTNGRFRRGRSSAFYFAAGGDSVDEANRDAGGPRGSAASFVDFSPINAIKEGTDPRFFPAWAGPLCAFFLAIFFSVTLTDLVPFGKDIKPYFERPSAPDGLLAKQFGIDTEWKFLLLFFGMCFLNMLGYVIQTQYVSWRWTFVVKPSDEETFASSGWKLALYSACCIIIELFLTTINIANLLVSFTNYVMLFQIALAHGTVIFIWAWMAKLRKERKLRKEQKKGEERLYEGDGDYRRKLSPLPLSSSSASHVAGAP